MAVIVQFLCDRLEDETGLKETSQGLSALQKSSRFGKEEAILVSSAYGTPITLWFSEFAQ